MNEFQKGELPNLFNHNLNLHSDSYVSSHLQGGLGNYMFQISAALGISKRDNKKLKIDLSDIAIIHSPIELYYENVFRKVLFGDVLDYEVVHSSHGKPIEFLDIPKIKGNLKLDGYYQNEKYFNFCKNEILDLFEIDNNTQTYLTEKYSDVLSQDTCSLHVRRGNYVDRQNFHPLQTISYYEKSVSIIGEDKLYVIFSDDINWCKENLNFIKNKIFVTDNLDYQDMYLMSMCKNNIIANSSFSWWGAWLNKNTNKKVVYPYIWFNFGPDASQIGCENWIKI
jgi:hypothetical protein